MYVDVAVCGARDPRKGTYTYYSDKRLHAGTLVEVSFGKKRTHGLVIATKEATDVKGVLPILRVPLPYPLYNERQLGSFNEIAAYYHTSVSILLSLVLPEFPKGVFDDYQRPYPQTKRKQRLMLAPTTFKGREIAALFARKNRPFLFYTSDLSLKDRAKAFLDARAGRLETIIATRSGLFLPLQNLQEIYLYDEHDWAYRELREPSYHALTVATTIAEKSQIPCIILDPTPRIQTWWQAKQQSAPLVLRETKISSQAPRIQIVDLVVEKGKGNTSLLSPQLIVALEACVKAARPTLLYLNKKNDGGLLYCKQCQFTSYATTLPTQCPQCKSEHIKFEVINLKHVAKVVNSLLHLWGYQNQTKTDGWKTDKEGSILTYHVQGKPLITIATQKILYHAHYGSYNLVGIVLADTLTNLPEYRANEKTYATFAQLYRLLAPTSSSQCIIQTRNLTHPVMQYFTRHDYEGFAKEELLERQALAYPPFALPILLRFEAKTHTTATDHARRLMEQLEFVKTTQETNSVEIIGPYAVEHNGLPALHKTHEIRILLKAENRLAAQAYLMIVPKNWHIAIDPENLVT